jgi:hypothetical protein
MSSEDAKLLLGGFSFLLVGGSGAKTNAVAGYAGDPFNNGGALVHHVRARADSQQALLTVMAGRVAHHIYCLIPPFSEHSSNTYAV